MDRGRGRLVPDTLRTRNRDLRTAVGGRIIATSIAAKTYIATTRSRCTTPCEMTRRRPINEPMQRFRLRCLDVLFTMGLFLPNVVLLQSLLSIHPRLLRSQITPSSSVLMSSYLAAIVAELEIATSFVRRGEVNARQVACPIYGLTNATTGRKQSPDYGSLNLIPWIERDTGIRIEVGESSFSALADKWASGRLILPNDDEDYHDERRNLLDHMDAGASWRDARYDHWEERDYPAKDGSNCYRPKWATEQHPSCLKLHENALFERSVGADPHHTFYFDFLARGHFRLSFLFTDASPMRDDFVLKPIRFLDDDDRLFDPFTFNAVGVEAIAMERTTASDRTIDIYGFCGGSVVLEPGRSVFQKLRPRKFFISQEVMERRHPHNAVPYNNLTSPEKLMISLAMAEGIAELHGDRGGVLVNRDVQIEQFVVARKSGKIKLVDFNNVLPLKWNAHKHEYCPYASRYNFVYRSPEELTGEATDESSDVYALGQVMYTILTGMLPYYSAGKYWKATALNKKGETPYLDPRYRRKGIVEGRLVDIMQSTWNKNRFARPSIFEVVQHLRDTVGMYEAQHNTTIANMTFQALAERDY